jgi:hypothetical protein
VAVSGIKHRKAILAVLIAGLCAYTLVAITPLKALIGRSSPSAASLFSPPWLNFAHTYSTGRVIDFRVGMTRAEVYALLVSRYSGGGAIIANCNAGQPYSLIPITRDLDVASASGGGDRICARLDPPRLGTTIYFKDDLVSSIKIRFIRMELP